MAVLFNIKNYLWIIFGVFVIFGGYLLMIGGQSQNPDVFNIEMFNFQRTKLAPIFILVGFIIVIRGILIKNKNSSNKS